VTAIDTQALRAWFTGLQQRIVEGLEAIDGGTFRSDEWTRPKAGAVYRA